MTTPAATEVYGNWPAIKALLAEGADRTALLRQLYAELERRRPDFEGFAGDVFRELIGYPADQTLTGNALYTSFLSLMDTLRRYGKLERVGFRQNANVYRVRVKDAGRPTQRPAVREASRAGRPTTWPDGAMTPIREQPPSPLDDSAPRSPSTSSKDPERFAPRLSSVPRARELYWPTLLALRAFDGRPAPKYEVVAWVADHLRLPGSVVRLLHFTERTGRSPETALGYRTAWAMSRLKKIGAAHNPVRARWVVTDFGRTIGDEQQLHELCDASRRQRRVNREPGQSGTLRPFVHQDEQAHLRGLGSRRSASDVRRPTRKTHADWILASMRMLVAAGVAEPSLDQIEYAAKALGWNGNSKSLRSAAWIAKREGLLMAAGHGRYRLAEAAPLGDLPAQQPAADLLVNEPGNVPADSPANDPVSVPTAMGSDDALAECVKRLADVVEELRYAVRG